MKRLVTSLALLVASLLSLEAQTYSVIDLGTLGGTTSHAYGINNSGQVVGDAEIAGDTTSYATLFSEVGISNVNLGTIGPKGSAALSINDAGSIVGYSLDPSYYHIATAFRYQGGTLVNLGNLGSFGATANSVNNNDQIVGDAAGTSKSPGTRFSGFGINNFELKGVNSTYPNGTARSSNSSNRVVGRSQKGATVITIQGIPFSLPYYTATVFNEGFANGQDLGTLGGQSSDATAINDSGQIVGSASTAEGNTHAIRFANEGFTTLDLGTLGGSSSGAYDINNAGDIVGYSNIATNSPVQHGFLYKNGTLIDLNTLIDPNLGIVINEARAINEAGQIAANGTVNGVTHAMRLTLVPPPPPVVTFRIFLKAAPPNKGTVVGGMDYPTGTLVTATARPKRGGVFLNWTEKGKIVSRSRIYRFKATKPRNLIARFK